MAERFCAPRGGSKTGCGVGITEDGLVVRLSSDEHAEEVDHLGELTLAVARHPLSPTYRVTRFGQVVGHQDGPVR